MQDAFGITTQHPRTQLLVNDHLSFFHFWMLQITELPTETHKQLLLLFLLLVYFCWISLGGDEHFNGRCCIKNFKH